MTKEQLECGFLLKNKRLSEDSEFMASRTYSNQVQRVACRNGANQMGEWLISNFIEFLECVSVGASDDALKAKIEELKKYKQC